MRPRWPSGERGLGEGGVEGLGSATRERSPGGRASAEAAPLGPGEPTGTHPPSPLLGRSDSPHDQRRWLPGGRRAPRKGARRSTLDSLGSPAPALSPASSAGLIEALPPLPSPPPAPPTVAPRSSSGGASHTGVVIALLILGTAVAVLALAHLVVARRKRRRVQDQRLPAGILVIGPAELSRPPLALAAWMGGVLVEHPDGTATIAVESGKRTQAAGSLVASIIRDNPR